MIDFKENIPFDPGYSKHLLIFAQNYLEGMEDIKKTINNNQKKFKFRLYVSKFDKALKSTLGFWVGCILWATYIKFKYPNKEIEGNAFLGKNKEDIDEYFYELEFKLVEDYILNYPKNTKFYLGKEMSFPQKYLEIVKDYKEFLNLNDNFLKTAKTNDIKLNQKFEKNVDLQEIEAKIDKALAQGDLATLLN